jgi:hypothetical protein
VVEKMKRGIAVALPVVFSLALIILGSVVFYRMDVAEQTPADLAKYPEMQGFFTACGEFEGGTLDIDTNVMRLAFRSDRAAEECFEELDRVAEQGGWTAVAAEGTKRVFAKARRRYPVDRRATSVTVSSAGDPGTVELVWR